MIMAVRFPITPYTKHKTTNTTSPASFAASTDIPTKLRPGTPPYAGSADDLFVLKLIL